MVGYSDATNLSFRWDGASVEEFSNGKLEMPNSANAISKDSKTIVGSDADAAYKWTRRQEIVALAPDSFEICSVGRVRRWLGNRWAG